MDLPWYKLLNFWIIWEPVRSTCHHNLYKKDEVCMYIYSLYTPRPFTRSGPHFSQLVFKNMWMFQKLATQNRGWGIKLKLYGLLFGWFVLDTLICYLITVIHSKYSRKWLVQENAASWHPLSLLGNYSHTPTVYAEATHTLIDRTVNDLNN